MPLDEQSRIASLQAAGLSPDEWDVDENGVVTQKSNPLQPAVNPKPTMPGVNDLNSNNSSALGAFGRQAAASAFPTAAGLAGGAATGAGIGALGGPAAPITVPLGAIIGGLASSYGASKLQDALLPDAAKQQLAQDTQQHPIASFAGGLVPSAIAFNPVKGIQQLSTVAKGIGKLATLNGEALTLGEKAATLNTGINVGTAAGQDIYDQIKSQEPFSIPQLLANVGAASILNEPRAFMKPLGFHSSADIDAALRAQLQQAQNTPTVNAVEPKPNVPSTMSPIDIANAMGGDYRNTTVPTSGKLATAEQRIPDAMRQYKSGEPLVPEETINTMEGEGGVNQGAIKQQAQEDILQKRREEFTKAQQEVLDEQIRQANLQRDALVKQNNDLELANNNPPSVSQNTLRITKDKYLPTEVNRPEVNDVTSLDNTKGMQEANQQLEQESAADLANRRLEGNTEDKYQDTSPLDKLTWEQLPSSFKNKVIDLSIKRGVSLEEARKLYRQDTGKEIAGKLNPDTRQATISTTKGMGDTGPHEIAHAWLDDLRNSTSPTDRELADRGLKIFGGDPNHAEEALVSRLGVEGHERIKNQLDGQALRQFESWYKDLKSRLKVKLGVGSDEDVIRHLSQRLSTDAEHGMRGEVDYNKPKYTGYQEGFGTVNGQKYYNLQNDVKDEKTGQNFVKGTTLPESKLKELGVKFQEESELTHPNMYDYVDEHYINQEQKSPEGLKLEDILEHNADVFKKYPYLKKLNVELVSNKNHPVLQGENARIQTLGNGEGTIYLNKFAWDDALNHKDPKGRVHLEKALLHEAGHAVLDAEDKNIGYGHDNKVTAHNERFADEFADKWHSGDEIRNQEKYQDKSPLSIPLAKPEIQKIQDKYGEQGKTVGDAFSNFYEKFRSLKGQLTNGVVGALRQHLNLLNPKELVTQNNEKLDRVRQYMDDVADSKQSSITLSPEEKEVEAIIRQNMADTLKEKNSRPNLPNTVGSDKYFPQVMGRKQLDILLNKPGVERQKLIQDFLNYQSSIGTKNPEEALKTFMAGYKNGDKNIAEQFGPIDKSAGVGIPQSWRETNLIDRMSRFNDRYARRLAYHDAIENNPSAMDALENPKSGIGNADTVRTVLDDIAGRKEHEEANRTAISGVVRAAMMGPLTGVKDFASNLTLGLQHQTPSQSVMSVVHAWKNMRDNIAESFKSGVNRYNVASFEFGDGGIENVTNILRTTRDVLNTVQGRNLLEQVTRATAFGQGKFLAMDNLAAINKREGTSQGRKFLKDFAPDIDLAKPPKEFSPEELNQIASRYVESVQGTYDYRGLPAVAQKGSLAPVLSLARWNIEKMNNFVKYNIEPARNGNFVPLLMSTLGMLIGGEAVNKIVELASGKKEKTPEVKEIYQAAKEGQNVIPSVAYKLAALSSMSGYAGMMGDVIKMAMDRGFKNHSVGYGNPLIDAAVNGADLTGDIVEAVKNGDLDITTDAISKVLETYFQSYRLALNQLGTERADINDKSNKMRDLKVYKSLHGLPVPDNTDVAPNPFLNHEMKQFKKTEDIQEAAQMLPELIQKAMDKSKGDPELLKSELSKLKINNYETMPNMETTPLAFFKYLQYLKNSQGDKVAQERLKDYMTRNALNQVKSSLVPSL